MNAETCALVAQVIPVFLLVYALDDRVRQRSVLRFRDPAGRGGRLATVQFVIILIIGFGTEGMAIAGTQWGGFADATFAWVGLIGLMTLILAHSVASLRKAPAPSHRRRSAARPPHTFGIGSPPRWVAKANAPNGNRKP